MRGLLVALVAFGVASCSPPAPRPAEAPSDAPAEAAAPAPGPYTNSWDSNEFSRFTHTLVAPSVGVHTLGLSATTDSPGGETVAVYLTGPDDEPMPGWRMFVVASTRGESTDRPLEFPVGSEIPVIVMVENASGRRSTGSYTLTISD